MGEPGTPSGEVTIGGRAFTLGVIYAPRLRRGYDRRPRRLLSYSTDGPLSGGRVMVEMVPAGGQRVMAGTAWAAWAGEPVEDVGRRAGERWPEAETSGRAIVREEEPPA